MYVLLSIISGFSVAFMIQMNGILQIAVGGTTALLLIHLSGLSGALFFLILMKNRMRGNPGEKSPALFLTAGMLGTLLVFLASAVYEKGGILLSLSGSLAGQTLAAAVVESLYSKDRDRSPFLQRILSPALLIPGSLLIGIRSGAGLLWILISWTPGIILMIQQVMNSRNTAFYGSPKTIVFNYMSALIIIIPLFLFINGFREVSLSGKLLLNPLGSLPWYVIAGGGLIGVFTTGMISYLFLVSPALLVTMGIYAGELTGGLVLDLYYGREFEILKLMGILCIAAGLGVGRISPPPESQKS